MLPQGWTASQAVYWVAGGQPSVLEHSQAVCLATRSAICARAQPCNCWTTGGQPCMLEHSQATVGKHPAKHP